MGANTGIGLPGDGGGGTDLSGLSDNQVPRFNAATNRLENSGFQIHPMTRALQGATNIETLADVQSGVSTFRLGQAHTMTSAGENVTFRNSINNVAFHPTWQTTESTGDWNSVQRTPVGDLIQILYSSRIDRKPSPTPILCLRLYLSIIACTKYK